MHEFTIQKELKNNNVQDTTGKKIDLNNTKMIKK